MGIGFQAELERYLDRADTLEQNMHKAYALIFSTYCNKTMQNRIEEHHDFESTIRDDPIELLEKIKVLVHDPVRSKYPYASLTEALISGLHQKVQAIPRYHEIPRRDRHGRLGGHGEDPAYQSRHQGQHFHAARR
jgi:hypothetical protein